MKDHHHRISTVFTLAILAAASGAAGCGGESNNPAGSDPAAPSTTESTESAVTTYPHRLIRVEAVLASHTDGSAAPTVTASDLRTVLQYAQTTFASANLEFLFDPESDVVRVNDTQ